MRRWAIAGALAVLALGAWLVVRPFMAERRDFPAEIPSPAALGSVDSVPLVRGRPVCFGDAVAEQRSQQARFKIAAPDGPAGPLRMTLRSADGSYRQAVRIPAGAVDGQQVSVPITAPPRSVVVKVCLANHGRRRVALLASSDRTRSRSIADVHGRPTAKSVWFSFFESAPRSITQRLSVTIRRMTTFRPGYVTTGVLWLLFVGMLLGVPAGLVWAVARAFAADEARAPGVDVAERRPAWRRWLE